MSKPSKPVKKSVELHPSRIRRDPAPREKDLLWCSIEWERRFAIIGIALFALAITLLQIGISEVTSH